MRIEVTDRSIDFVGTKSGFMVGAVDAIAFALLLAIANLKVVAIIVVMVAALTLPIAWLQHRRPERAAMPERGGGIPAPL